MSVEWSRKFRIKCEAHKVVIISLKEKKNFSHDTTQTLMFQLTFSPIKQATRKAEIKPFQSYRWYDQEPFHWIEDAFQHILQFVLQDWTQ